MNTHAEFQSASGYTPITKIGVGVGDALDTSLGGHLNNDDAAMPRVEQNEEVVSPEVRCLLLDGLTHSQPAGQWSERAWGASRRSIPAGVEVSSPADRGEHITHFHTQLRQ